MKPPQEAGDMNTSEYPYRDFDTTGRTPYQEEAKHGEPPRDFPSMFHARESRPSTCQAPSACQPPARTAPTASLPRLSVVVPCYNEERSLPEFYSRISQAARTNAGDDYEIVLVNDGSHDRTLDVMRLLADSDLHLLVVDLSRNFGHQKALLAGLSFSRGERILLIDADLQDPPELLGDMMRVMDAGVDVVYGQRRRREGETRFKVLSAHLFYHLLTRLADVPIPADTGDFRLMNRKALQILREMPEQALFLRGMVSWIGLRQAPILYDRARRLAGRTAYSLPKMILLALDAITAFSVVPLRLASYLGVATSLASIPLIAYALISWFAGAAVAGWTSLAALIVTVSGVQLLLLGVLGEYVGRIYTEVKRRPHFVIKGVYHQQHDKAA